MRFATGKCRDTSSLPRSLCRSTAVAISLLEIWLWIGCCKRIQASSVHYITMYYVYGYGLAWHDKYIYIYNTLYVQRASLHCASDLKCITLDSVFFFLFCCFLCILSASEASGVASAMADGAFVRQPVKYSKQVLFGSVWSHTGSGLTILW